MIRKSVLLISICIILIFSLVSCYEQPIGDGGGVYNNPYDEYDNLDEEFSASISPGGNTGGVAVDSNIIITFNRIVVDSGWIVTIDGTDYTPASSETAWDKYRRVLTIDPSTAFTDNVDIGVMLSGFTASIDGASLSGTTLVTFYTYYPLRSIGPACGLIFYDKGIYSDGWRYLEAAPASTEWKGKEWGCCGTDIDGAEGTALGTGAQNTIDILNATTETNIAACLCDDLIVENNGVNYDDWFLPSKGELDLMYENLHEYGVGGFADSVYWSSSELNFGNASPRGFPNGPPYDGYGKYCTYKVRAARAF